MLVMVEVVVMLLLCYYYYYVGDGSHGDVDVVLIVTLVLGG